jgi:response regulator RpfG family c-di-GMP phosphodiesterase
MLMAMYENYDGTGIPHRCQGWHIPAGARILRVVEDYAELVWRDGYDHPEALSKIQQRSHRIYDQRIVVLLDQYLSTVEHSDQRAVVIPLRVENFGSRYDCGA